MSAEWATLVNLEGLTWGDLRRLVCLADARELSDETEVDFEIDEFGYSPSAIRISGQL